MKISAKHLKAGDRICENAEDGDIYEIEDIAVLDSERLRITAENVSIQEVRTFVLPTNYPVYVTNRAGVEKRDAVKDTALNESIRALRDIVALDPNRPAANSSEKVARRALERLEKILGIPGLAAEGHTYGPDEDFPGVNC